MSEVMAQIFATRFAAVPPVAVLSGPSFALETGRGDPTAVVVAANAAPAILNARNFRSVADFIQAEFAGPG